MRLPARSTQSPLLSTLSGTGPRPRIILKPGTSICLQAELVFLSGRNRRLKALHLHDMKLSDCFPDILNLLENCELEGQRRGSIRACSNCSESSLNQFSLSELQLSDCRLLEECPDKDGRLQQLVDALKRLPSLHTLGLAKNRIGKPAFLLFFLLRPKKTFLILILFLLWTQNCKPKE